MISFSAQLIFQILFGAFTDFIHKKEYMSGTTCCKLCQGFRKSEVFFNDIKLILFSENIFCAASYLGLGFYASQHNLLLAGVLLFFNGKWNKNGKRKAVFQLN